ncbi:MAG: hypothetical protein DSM106950_02885 [Stigonema ocellatum SAG 48.90 = DSM 106950]|nr:hypothetical protein [Stigonema ocellatum SAG 48.90 = DSM 106950]
MSMIQFLLLLMVLISPTLLILSIAIATVGFNWRLLLIPIGAIVGAILLSMSGFCLSYLLYWKDHDKNYQPGSMGGFGGGILTMMVMVLFGWIGSGFGACWVAKYWVH